MNDFEKQYIQMKFSGENSNETYDKGCFIRAILILLIILISLYILANLIAAIITLLVIAFIIFIICIVVKLPK